MNNTYTHPKDLGFEKETISAIKIGFDNGECLHLSGRSIVDLSLEFYDRLIFTEQGMCPFIHSGYLKLRPKSGTISKDVDDTRLIDMKKYRASRLSCIVDRLVKKGGIESLVICTEYDFCGPRILGNFAARIEGEFVIIEARPKPFDEPYKSEHFSIDLPQIVKEDIFSISLNFENFDHVTVYQDEIKEIELEIAEQLVSGGNDNLEREINGGHLIIEIKSRRGESQYRPASLEFAEEGYRSINNENVLRRIAGYEDHCCGIGDIDISFQSPRDGRKGKETLGVAYCGPELSDEEWERDYDGDEEPYGFYHIGGTSKFIGKNRVRVDFGYFKVPEQKEKNK